MAGALEFLPGRYRIPPDFKLWPDNYAVSAVTVMPRKPVGIRELPAPVVELGPGIRAINWPTTPPIPPIVASGDIITAIHENTVTTALDDLWTNLQWLETQGSGQGAVTSVFGRTGVIVPVAGDYTAAMVTNAVSTLGSYSNPAWITSLAWSKVSGAPAFLTSAVTSLQGLTGAVTLAAGANVTITPSGQTITISATGGGSGTSQWTDIAGGGIYYSGGRVGINTPSPQALLQVGGTSDHAWDTSDVILPGNIYFAGYNSANPRAFLQAHDSSGVNSIGFRFRTSNAGALVDAVDISPIGNVGILVNSPNVALEVAGASVAVAGPIARFYHGPKSNRSVEIGTGLTGASPWPPYIQARDVGTTPLLLSLNPAGGAVSVGNDAGPVQGLFGVTNGRSAFCANNESFAVALYYANGVSPVYVGCNSSSNFVVSNEFGQPLLRVEPGTGNTYVGAANTGAVYFGNTGAYIFYTGSAWSFNPPLPTGGIATQTKPGRGWSSIYQNTTGKPMFVIVSLTMQGAGAAVAYSDASGVPATPVAEVGATTQASPPVMVTLPFWVLPGNYYYVAQSVGAGWNASIGNWTEYY